MSENKVLCWDDIKDDKNAIRILGNGFIYLKSVFGSDEDICSAARISYGKGTHSVSDNRNLIRYLIRHHHNSPCEQACIVIIYSVPLFIQTQILRHRTAKLNQYSGRYSEMPEEYFYLGDNWRSQGSDNKQGGEAKLEYHPMKFNGMIAEDISQAEYKNRLSAGMSRELARTVLPQSQFTRCILQLDIHNLCHFLQLRLDSHAQKEIREFAEAVYKLAKPHFPLTFEAFEDYVLNAKTFSINELRILKELLEFDIIGDIIKESPNLKNLSKRELNELLDKLSYIKEL